MIGKFKNKSKPIATEISETPRSEDKLGVYPTEVHVPSLENRRALWTARAFAIGMFLSLAVNIALGFALAALEPWEKRIQPMLITVKSKTDQIMRVEPFEKDVKGIELLTESMVRDYIVNRESIIIDDKIMENIWGPKGYIYWRSTPAVYKVFKKQLPEYKKRFEKQLHRDVEILAMEKIPSAKQETWSIKFKTIDINDKSNEIAEIKTFRATLSLDFSKKRVSHSERFMNPIGFVVTKYTVSPIALSDNK